MNLHKLILTENECYKRGNKITVKGIMVHSTGANNPNLKRYVGPDDGLLGANEYGNHWNTYRPSGIQVCVHAFIGKLKDGTIATYQTLPWNHRGWHCAGTANNTHIGFEICEDALTDASYFAKVYQEAVELCAYLCKMYNLDPTADGVIIAHYEGYERSVASNHSDPKYWFAKHGKNMDTFRTAVKAELAKSAGGSAAVEQPETKTETTTGSHLYRVRKYWGDKASQIGAYRNLENAIAVCIDGYKVYNELGNVVYTPSTASTEKEAFEVAKTWKNGSTSEPVYADTDKKTKVGSLNPYESCDCLGTVGGMYIVKYKVDGTSGYKVGVVAYSGGL